MNKIIKKLLYNQSKILTVLIIVILISSISGIDWKSGIIHKGAFDSSFKILKAFLRPDISIEIIGVAFSATIRTLVYAITGMTIGLVLSFFTGIFASGKLQKSTLGRKFTKGVWRSILGVVRGVHELVWAWLFVAYIGLTPVAGVLAIGIPYGAALGRVFADILNDVPEEPIKSLESSGANKKQVILYGYLPYARRDMISYSLYRLECAIRASVIMSFIGLGGLGYNIQLALSDLDYNRAATFIYFLIILITLIDIWSNQIRKDLV